MHKNLSDGFRTAFCRGWFFWSVTKMCSLNPLKQYRLNDIDFARLFMDVYVDCLCYVPKRKSCITSTEKSGRMMSARFFVAKQCIDFVTLLFFLMKDIEENLKSNKPKIPGTQKTDHPHLLKLHSKHWILEKLKQSMTPYPSHALLFSLPWKIISKEDYFYLKCSLFNKWSIFTIKNAYLIVWWLNIKSFYFPVSLLLDNPILIVLLCLMLRGFMKLYQRTLVP